MKSAFELLEAEPANDCSICEPAGTLCDKIDDGASADGGPEFVEEDWLSEDGSAATKLDNADDLLSAIAEVADTLATALGPVSEGLILLRLLTYVD